MTDPNKAYDMNIQAAHRAHDRQDALENQLNDGAFKAADMALRTVVAINGGAIIALLALIGALVGRDKINGSQIGLLISYFSWFIYGVVAGVASMAGIFLAYFTATFSYRFRSKTYEHPYLQNTCKSLFYGYAGIAILIAAILVGLSSVGFFVKGVTSIQVVLTHLL
jgi:hypothetical protein